jgi:hypothetical protein
MTGRLRSIVAASAWASITAACLGFTGGACRQAWADDMKPVQEAKPARQPQPDLQEQQRRQQAQHWEGQLSRLLHSHLNLIRTLCGELSREQRRAIALVGEKATKEAAAWLADEQLGQRRQQMAKRQPADRPPKAQAADASSGDDPAAAIAAALQEALADTVGAERAAAFTAELAAREERRRQSVVASLVGILGTELWLTTEQREAVERSLLEHWDESMVQALQGRHMINGRRVLPGVRDEFVRPHLTAMQLDVYGPPKPARGGMPAWQALMHRLGQCSPHLNRDPWWFE